MLLHTLKQFPQKANTAGNAPIFKQTGKVKPFSDWNLTEMIDVAHSLSWINYDVKNFSHALREFRNLIHPNKQLELNTFPDADTVKICLSVFNASVNDLSKLFLSEINISSNLD